MDLTRDRMVRFVGKAWDQVKSPLYRNAFYLMLAYVVGQALGLAFWVVAYRFYSSNDAGYAIAMINTLTFLAGVATLGMPVALIRFLPETDNPTALLNSVATVSGAIVLVMSLVFIVGLPVWAPGLVVQFWRPEYVPIVVLTAVAYTFGPVLDQAAVAARRADLYFWRIVIFSVTKIPLPVVFALWLGDALLRIRVLGIFMSWSIAFGASVLVPLVIINTLRPTTIGGVVITSSDSTAVYYAATVVAGSLAAIPAATMTSLYAEASQRNAARRQDERRAIGLSLALLVPGVVALWFLADPLLRILFDLKPELADLGGPALQVLGLAAIPVFLNTVFGTRVRIRKQVAPLIISSAIMTATTLVLGYLFLVWFGLIGLAWAFVIGNVAPTPYLFLAAGKPLEEEAIEPAPIVP